MGERAPIIYRGFWDVPRIFLARHAGHTFLFDCAFDEVLDDYPDVYRVYLMPEISEESLPHDWTILPSMALRYLGTLPVSAVHFDSSRRQSIDTIVLSQLLAREVVVG